MFTLFALFVHAAWAAPVDLTFDTAKEIHCSISNPFYSEAEKITISPANRFKMRDLRAPSLGSFSNACEAEGDFISCDFRTEDWLSVVYLLKLDLTKVAKEKRANGSALTTTGTISKSLALAADVSCYQNN